MSRPRSGNSRQTSTLNHYLVIKTRETRMNVINMLFLD